MSAPVLAPVLVTFAGRTLELRPPHRPAYVVETWLRSYERETGTKADVAAWMTAQGALAEDLLSLVLCAYLPEAPHTIQAWACGSPGVLHYAYVPDKLRRRGLATMLVEAVAGSTGGVHTHRKPRYLAQAFRAFRFDPYGHALAQAVRRAVELRLVPASPVSSEVRIKTFDEETAA